MAIFTELLQLFNESVFFFLSFVICIGLVFGSFFNVVIHRLPLILYRNWTLDSKEFLAMDLPERAKDIAENYNLVTPRSHCPECKVMIRACDNIPVISFIWLRGRCRNCKTPIAKRYLLIELFTAGLFALTAWHFGVTSQAVAALVLTSCLITQSIIDFNEQIIPDEITIPCLWLGLLLSLAPVFATSHDAILGAVAGYMVFYIIFWIFYFITGKEGMGQGDFKLLAMLGAWLGWQYLAFIVVCSALLGAVVGITLILTGKQQGSKPIPFGPYIAIAGYIALLWGAEINNWYLHNSGLAY